MAVCCWYAHNRLTGCLHCGNQTNVVKSANPLWLVEYYSKGPEGQEGWDIKFAWVQAVDVQAAVKHLEQADKAFDCIILVDMHAKVHPLSADPGKIKYLHDLNPA